MAYDAKLKKINDTKKLIWQNYMKIAKKPLLLGIEEKKGRRFTCKKEKAELTWEQTGLAKGNKKNLFEIFKLAFKIYLCTDYITEEFSEYSM